MEEAKVEEERKGKGRKRRDEKYAARKIFRLLQFIVKQTDDRQRQRPERGGVPSTCGPVGECKIGRAACQLAEIH